MDEDIPKDEGHVCPSKDLQLHLLKIIADGKWFSLHARALNAM
ncbi:hypothetical protein [Maridesulfovibrio sp.]|nr:hypothetical protein [Maridesulfovibrio sp.]